MSISSKASKLLTNQYVLYFVVFLALTTIFGYMAMNDTNTVILFILIGLVSSIFTRNMIIILGLSILITNLLVVTRGRKEGLENPTTPDTTTTSKTPSGTSTNPMPDTNIGQPSATVEEDEPQPKQIPMTNMDNVGKKVGSNRIDYASTLEEAYDNLDSILGGDGIKQLTTDTKQLMMKQQELFKSMESMAPMLESAKGMLEGFDLKSLEGLTKFAGGFSSALGQDKDKNKQI
jgi:hypothetical protein